MTLAICVATMSRDVFPGDILTWTPKLPYNQKVYIQHNTPENNLGVVGSYEKLYRESTEEILLFLHDDVICREEGWDERVLREFEDPSVGVVGFGGALRHGADELYKVPYRLQQLARYNYRSNVDDAEVHGERFTGSCEVAVVDGFAIAVRRSLLDRCGGWQPDRWPSHHIYDYRICCEAHRHGYCVRIIGIRCHHRGGITAVSSPYLEWAKKTKWGGDVEMHVAGHKILYEEYRDVLPWDCR